MAERLLVRDLMSVGVATCPTDTPIVDITRLLLDKQLEGIVVLDGEGHAVGSISRDELVQAYTRDDCRGLTAEDVMRDSVPQIPPDIPLIGAVQIMRDMNTRVVFLLHNSGGIQYPAAALSYTHILRHLASRSDADLQDLGIAAARKAPLETFIEKRDAARRQSHNPHQE